MSALPRGAAFYNERLANQTTTMVSGIPLGWAIAATSAMAVLLALAAAATAVQLIRRRS